MQPQLLFPDTSYPTETLKDLSLLLFRETCTTIFENFDLCELLRNSLKPLPQSSDQLTLPKKFVDKHNYPF